MPEEKHSDKRKPEPLVRKRKPAEPGKRNKKDLFVGKTLGHCKILEKINEGGTAYIYRAFNTSFKLHRVVKILKPALSDEEDFYVRFIQEAQLTARLDHPNILRVFDTGEINGFYYIEMEYIEGKSLRSFISERSKISEKETLTIASQLVRALNYAHNVRIKAPSGEMITGILHRDIKPENIMFTKNHTVKLMDFGAAKPMNLTSNTMQGMIVGTFHYMSPEQLAGKRLDARSDFFSLGIVLYEIFSGSKPFSSDKLVSLISIIKTCKYTPLRKMRPSISPLTEELVDRLLEKKTDNRPRTTKEILETIQICLQSHVAWGGGKRVRIPFSFKRFYPTFSLIISCFALCFSLLSYFNNSHIRMGSFKKDPAIKELTVSLLENGRKAEHKRLWREAMNAYSAVPSPSDGGIVNEYLEAKIREARIGFAHTRQLTKARSILEKLRMDYTDPSIDAYLGQIYFKQALYTEARDRLEAAINSEKGSVIKHESNFKRKLHYHYANSLDRQYIYIDQDPSVLREAIKSWNYYLEYSACADNKKDKDCSFAKKRLKELEKVDKKINTK